MKIKNNFLIFLSFLLLFSAFLYNYLSSNLWDYDFWWHIATGRYIVQNGSLPQTDPFCYTSDFEENKNLHPERESFILKQYWLAQVIFYLIYENTGNKGIIILRGMIIVLVIFLVFYALHKRNVKFYISFLFTFLVYIGIGGFSGERPVLFTILFSVIAFLLLEDFRENRCRRLFILPPLMLLWANMHGGFVLGDVIIATYMLGETIKIFRKQSTFTRQETIRFYFISVLAIAASFINPNGITAFFITFSSKYKFFTGGIQEYQPPIILYMNKLSPIEYSYIAMVLLLPLILVLRGKKMNITHIIILIGLCFISLSSMRFTIYYLTIGSIMLGTELNSLTERFFEHKMTFIGREKLMKIFAVFVFISSLLYFINVFKFESFKFREASLFSVPKEGVDFIEKNNLKGRIFNDFGSGGYLTWRLYPKYKIFIDTRAINGILMQEYTFIVNSHYSKTSIDEPVDKRDNRGKSQLWERLLDHYDINLIFLTPLDVYGYIPRLVFKLAESDKWVPVYNGALSIIFVRNSELNKDIIERFRKTKYEVFDTVILQASLRARDSKENPIYLASLGETFYKIGRLEDSLKAYKHAFQRRHDSAVQEKINQIESELKNKKEKKEI